MRLGNKCCLSLIFGRYLILAKLHCPNMLEQGFAFSREMAFSQRREFCYSWNNLPKFGQDIEAFGEISVCTTSRKCSLYLPQGQFALYMFSTRTSERSFLKALSTRAESSGANTFGEPRLLLLGPGNKDKADGYLNAGGPRTKSRQGYRWNR